MRTSRKTRETRETRETGEACRPFSLRFDRPSGTLLGAVPRFRVALQALAPLLVALGCGPGFESMHESNLRFEHCYRLDMDPKIAPSHREYCWRDWTQVYAYAQPLDRIEYARRRIVALESGDDHLMTLGPGAPTKTRVFEEESAGASETPMAAPAPTSAREPPPRIAPAPPPPAPSGVVLPGNTCAGPCESTFDACSRLCEAKQADCVVCREDYRRCMRRCFE